jgi:hypothetical protein
MFKLKIFLIIFGILISGCSMAPRHDAPPDLGLSKSHKFVLVSRDSTELEMVFIPPKKREMQQDFFWYYLDLNFSHPTPF